MTPSMKCQKCLKIEFSESSETHSAPIPNFGGGGGASVPNS
jgi:hypothetical protein